MLVIVTLLRSARNDGSWGWSSCWAGEREPGCAFQNARVDVYSLVSVCFALFVLPAGLSSPLVTNSPVSAVEGVQ